jgi:hypothetical protein
MNAFGRIMTVVMFGAICFALIVPLALQRGNPWLAAGVAALFLIYALANVFLWRLVKPRR